MKKMSKIISILMIIAIPSLIAVATIIKVSMNHQELELLVSRKKIEEAARRCVIDETCKEEIISLGYLIKKGYIKEQVHPVSKEFINEGTPITCKGYTCTVELF